MCAQLPLKLTQLEFCNRLKAAGFDAASLKAAGFDLASLKAAGFDAASLKAAPFDLASLKAAGFDAASMLACQSIAYNGHVYKSLAGHDPHSQQAISEYNHLYPLDPAWELCPRTPDALHVCATYHWSSYALVLADGSAHWTKLAPTAHASYVPGQTPQ